MGSNEAGEPERFTVERDGFHGFLHRPERDRFPGKALIVVGGSEGDEAIPLDLGRMFARAGIATLGLCYWNVPGLPAELVEVPLESVERAAAFLKRSGFERVALYGLSKGGELALIAASLMPDITCVVVLSPLNYVMCGITGNGSLAKKGTANVSSWTWRGRPVEPFVPGFKVSKAGIVCRLVTERQLDMCWLYERALQKAPAGAEIAVENIGGPVLLVCAADDRMWPSATACRAVEERLRVRTHPHAVKRLEYEHASHLIVPLASPLLRAFKVERTHPRECAASRADAFRQTMDFLRAW